MRACGRYKQRDDDGDSMPSVELRVKGEAITIFYSLYGADSNQVSANLYSY